MKVFRHLLPYAAAFLLAFILVDAGFAVRMFVIMALTAIAFLTTFFAWRATRDDTETDSS